MLVSRALVQKAKARPGQTVLVHGASGGVGIAAVQIAVALGLQVIGTASTKEGRDLVAQQGAHQVFNHRDSDYIGRVKLVTKDGAGVDIVIEVLADVNLVKDLDVIQVGGTVVVVGSRGEVDKLAPGYVPHPHGISTID
jgi:NADPH2:quinone reductase